MEFLPLFHNLRGSRVLVVGGGEIALRKSRLLADAVPCCDWLRLRSKTSCVSWYGAAAGS